MNPARRILFVWWLAAGLSFTLPRATAAAPADVAPESTAAGGRRGSPVVTPARTVLPAGRTVAVPMDLGSGQPVVEVTLDGRGPYRMFLDTGAGSTVLDRSLADELGLRHVGTTRIGDPADPEAIAADVVLIDSLRIGGARFEAIRAASWDRSALRRDSDPPRGVIGFAVFRELLLTLDYPAAEVRLARGNLPAADGQTILRYADPNGVPAIPIEVAGTRLEADLDTGSPGFLSIPQQDTSRVRFAGALEVMGRGRTVNSEVLFRGAAVDGAVTIGKHRFDHAVVMVQDALPNPNLGGRALRDFALTFDQRARRIRFERTRVSPPEAFAPPRGAPGRTVVQGPATGGKTAGVMLAPQPDGSLIVAGTLPGSAASRADLAAGDHVLELNGTPVESMNDEARLGALHHSPVTLTLARGERTFEITLEF